MNGERVYVDGDIWEDRDGDEWEYDGRNGCLAPHPGGVASLKPEFVEERWGPLVLKKPAEDNYTEAVRADIHVSYESALKDWEKELLSKSSTSFEQAGTFRLPEMVLERLDDGFVGYAVDTYEAALNVLLKKNADYGSRNIAESPGGPLNGLRVRMWDKMARINNLMDSGAEPENESLRDSFLDLMNYSAIALMVLDGNWPGTEET